MPEDVEIVDDESHVSQSAGTGNASVARGEDAGEDELQISEAAEASIDLQTSAGSSGGNSQDARQEQGEDRPALPTPKPPLPIARRQDAAAPSHVVPMDPEIAAMYAAREEFWSRVLYPEHAQSSQRSLVGSGEQDGGEDAADDGVLPLSTPAAPCD